MELTLLDVVLISAILASFLILEQVSVILVLILIQIAHLVIKLVYAQHAQLSQMLFK